MNHKHAIKRLRAIERLQRGIRSKYLHALPPPRGTPLQMALIKKMAADYIDYLQLEYNLIFSQLKNL
jgi:hypothetical protein